MTMSKIYEVEKGLADTSHVNAREYKQLYKESIENPDLFWSKQAEAFIDWEEKWDQISRTNMKEGEIAWFLGAKLNVAQNCLDRHDPFEKYINEIYKREICVSPLKSLSVHFTNVNSSYGLSPFIDYKKLWKESE